MVSIGVSADIKKAKKQLTRIQKKQLPFAIAGALNDIAFQARKAEANAQKNYLDKPTPFTNKGFRVHKANKRTLVARIEIPANRWVYLKKKVLGGTSSGRQAIGVAAPRNAYGNLPRTKSRTLGRRKDTFSKTINGRSGLWKREKDGRLSLQILFKDTTKHRKSYPLWKATDRVIKSRFKHALDKKISFALATAR